MSAEPTLPDDLLAVLAHLDGADAVAALLGDILTPAETEAVTERWGIVKALAAGQSQRGVAEAVGCSVTTVGRGARQLRYGRGGFALAFDTLAHLGQGDPRRAPATEEGGR